MLDIKKDVLVDRKDAEEQEKRETESQIWVGEDGAGDEDTSCKK